jgi:predicted N-acetyltransferase YhbS
MSLVVEDLTLHPGWIGTIARWHFDEWGPLTGSESSEKYRASLECGLLTNAIPSALVAYSGDNLLGSVSLIACDMNIRTELSPWLAQLFVMPNQRSRGIGSLLVRSAVDRAQTLGFGRFYLYTSGNLPLFYQRLGWTVRERVDYLGKERTVMQIELPAGNDSAGLAVPRDVPSALTGPPDEGLP